jgi:ubiquinone/menaquinone biosynthesis C-methylase UbiE
MRWMERGFMSRLRRQALAGLTGHVLEIGAGTGANFAYYPTGVRVVALEPDPFMLKRAEARLAALGRGDITLRQAPAEELPFDDASFDAVVSTLVLCTVRDPLRALAEVRRVLRPEGQLIFVEHVRADGLAGAIQDIIRPAWSCVGAGCNPNRRTEGILRDAGFAVTVDERRRIMGFVPVIAGTASPRP